MFPPPAREPKATVGLHASPPPARNRGGTGAFDLATAAYTALAASDRRAAATLFDQAIAAAPDDPRAAAWQHERATLTRRWSGDAYILVRDGGGTALAASPLLGAGQAGASLGYTLDPLARRPIAIVARAAVATTPQAHGFLPRGLDGSSAQLALGIRWRLTPNLSLSAERLIAAGSGARDDWTLRIAGGAQGERGRALWSGYGEAGAIANGDIYAGGQARLALRLSEPGPVTLSAGPGVWGSIQRSGGATSGRFDFGPSVAVHIADGRVGFDVSADYRARLAGNARPGSGPAVTVAASF